MISRTSVSAMLVAAVVLVGFVMPNSSAEDTATVSSSEQNMEVCRNFVKEVFNSGNLAYVEEHVSPDFVDHDPFPGQTQDLAGLLKGVEEFRAGFPDGVMTIKKAFATDDMVTLISTFSGTNSGPLWGSPASGKAVSEIEVIDVLRFENGKCVEHWGQMDAMKMMTQLGQMGQ